MALNGLLLLELGLEVDCCDGSEGLTTGLKPRLESRKSEDSEVR